ncbi:acyl-CoA dehydrogenase [Aestuariicella hydrocarbonica]|uniref:Acyl-CoA dehydrogenase n=1 Tax=Pseudomaricurvus hydrocarbonicus TaxID=1470433 RepID=A0A9E5JUX9_9GAMM|nr:acyl-CoA dehydrogenase family protein [Aestuariicella hydrocarbonica]NHO66043.1 acyl-CoA dehydrogenase [Aestuariicella hydrocarbonica]
MSSLDQFRQETREWLSKNCPESQRQPVKKNEIIWGGRRRKFPSVDAQLWFERMRDKGWIAPDWPKEYGGGNLSVDECKILEQEMRSLGCRPPLYDQGLWMFGPALLKYGSEDQKKEHLTKITQGEIRWCQGYSEPGAGSDLAGLKTKAEDCGDHFLVNGSKIWTTYADQADWIFCLVRTNTEVAKQQGISFLLIDMESEGVTTSPIELISGESEFCQTFFDNVKVPKENLVYEVDKGWEVAKEVLKHERKLISKLDHMTEKEDRSVMELAKEVIGLDSNGKLRNSSLRDQLTRHLMAEQADQLSGLRIFQQMRAGQPDPKLPLTMKYANTSEQQRKDELFLAILGNQGLTWQDEAFPKSYRTLVQNWAYNKSLTIAGGTSEIQLNIIAKRALGLPE